jgi:hypothetical protein
MRERQKSTMHSGRMMTAASTGAWACQGRRCASARCAATHPWR